MKMIRLIGFLLCLVPGLALGTTTSTPPEIFGNPGRVALGIGPNRFNIRDYGGYADAWTGTGYFGASGTSVDIIGYTVLNVTLSSAGGTTATVSPSWVVPYISGLTGQTYIFDAPNTNTSSTATHGNITVSDPSAGIITLAAGGSANFAVQTNTAATITLTASLGAARTQFLHGADYGNTTVSNFTNGLGQTLGSTVVLPDAIFLKGGPFGTNTALLQGLKLCIVTTPGSDWCGKIVGDQTAGTDGRTVQVAGLPPYSIVAPLLASAPAKIYFGPFLFRSADATACSGSQRSVEIPGAGAGTNLYTGTQNPFEGKVGTYLTPFDATLTATVSTVTGTGMTGEIRDGCDDWPAYQKAVNVLSSLITSESENNALYFPADSFMASGSGANIEPYMHVIQCGEGTVFWPSFNQVMYHGAGACSGRAGSPFDPKDVIPSAHFRHLLSLPPGSPATLVTAGNSPFGPGSNNAGYLNGRHSKLCHAFEQAFPLLVWKCVDRSVGGTQMYAIDPHGITNGIPLGVPMPAWYSDLTKKWLADYIQGDAPDVLVMGFADQETTSWHLGALLSSVAYTQTAAWATATGKNPDIGLMPWPMQTAQSAFQMGDEFNASYQRSYAKACRDKLASGGCVFLLDMARAQLIAAEGWDPEAEPMRRSVGNIAFYQSNNLSTFPVSQPRPSLGLTIPLDLQNAASSMITSMFSTVGGEIDMTVSGNTTSTASAVTFAFQTTADNPISQAVLTVGGNACKVSIGFGVSGQTGLPASAKVQSVNCGAGTVTLNGNITVDIPSGRTITFTPAGPATNFPGGTLRLAADGGGNYAYAYDAVYFATGATCSIVNGTATLTCTANEIGRWHNGLDIAIPGAGSSQCPGIGSAANCLLGTIQQTTYAVGGGSTTTLNSANASASVGPIAVTIYRRSIPYTISARPLETYTGNCVQVNGSTVRLSVQTEYEGSKLALTVCDTTGYPGPSKIIDRYVERFGVPFRYSLTSPNSMASTVLLADSMFSAFAGASSSPGGSVGTIFEMDPSHPYATAYMRLIPDIFGPSNADLMGSAAIWGGTFAAHQGQLGAHGLDDQMYQLIRFDGAGSSAGSSIEQSTITANALIGTLPPNATILYAVARETAGHNVTIGFGTTSGATDVAAGIALTANTSTNIPITSFAASWFSNSSSQSIFIDSASWNSASVNITIYYTVGP